MKFRTEINISKLIPPIEHSDKILTLGSCFAENIGSFLKNYKFNISVNPFGVLYNPVSILNSLSLLRDKKLLTKNELVFHQSEWHSFYHHSDFSHHDPDTCIENINEVTNFVNEFAGNTDIFIISYGTAFVYRHLEKNIIVSNCHKIPQTQFEKKLLHVDEITNAIKSTIKLIHDFNSNSRIIFTISPVRHLKDGFVENQMSKSHLFNALHEVIKDDNNSYYFPSYEILMDDLRDYRYYSDDLIHPNKAAIDYICEKFSNACFSEDCNSMLVRIEKLLKAVDHRIRNPKSENSIKFLKRLESDILEFQKEHPHINLETELETIQKKLS